MHAEERSPDGNGKRGIRRRDLSPSDCNEMDRQREKERGRETEEDGDLPGELGEKLMKNIKIQRRKEARELKRRRCSRREEDSQVAER